MNKQMTIKCQQTHLHWKRVSRWHGKSLVDTHTWQRKTLKHTEHTVCRSSDWLGLCLASVSKSVPASMKRIGSLTQKDGVHRLCFFVGRGAILTKGERESGLHGWREKKAMDGQTESEQATTGRYDRMLHYLALRVSSLCPPN